MTTATTEGLRGRVVRDCYGRWLMYGRELGAHGIEIRFSDGHTLIRLYCVERWGDNCTCIRSANPTCEHVQWLDSQ